MVGVTGLKSTSDLDQQRLWDEIKRLTLETVNEPAYTFKKLFVRPVGSPKVRVPKESYLQPLAIEDGATPDYSKLIGEYTVKDIIVKEYALATGITRNTIEDSDEDEVRWLAARALKAMKDNQENIVIAAVDATPLTGAVLSANDTPPPYGSETFSNTHDHTLTGGLTVGNIDSGIALVNEHGHTADYMLCHPANVQDVLDLITSVDVTGSAGTSNSAFFDEPGYLEGIAAVKRIRGLRILTNAWVVKDRYYVAASAVKPVAWYEKRNITVEQDPRAGYGIVGTWYSNRFGVVLLYPTAFAIISA